MYRFVLKFSKTGYARYTSHLDMLDFFKRAFRCGGIELRYSRGFNPHPKMSFAQPLSLGYGSCCELLEFETEREYEPAEILSRVRHRLPEGIITERCFVMPEGAPSLASSAVSADYIVRFPVSVTGESLEKAVSGYLARNEIMVLKRRKKDKKLVETDIKGMIRDLRGKAEDGAVVLFMSLDCGSVSNCSPELVISSFLEFTGFDLPRYRVDVERTALKFVNNLQF